MSANKRLIRLLAIAMAILFLIPILLFVFKKSDMIVVKNYEGIVKNTSNDQRDSIFRLLYSTVALNLPEGMSPNVSDAMIRKGTNKQTLNETQNRRDGEFIVDIKSINQSYLINYFESDDKQANLAGNTFVYCLPVEDLIYGDFGCVDTSTDRGAPLPLKDRLPYTDISGPFKINYVGKGTYGEDRIAITNSTPDGRKDALIWLRSKGVDPIDVSIDYFNFSNAFSEQVRDY